MKNHTQQDIPEYIPVPSEPQEEKPVSKNSSPDFIIVNDAREKSTKPFKLPEPENIGENSARPNFILPAHENTRPSGLFWSISISLACFILLIFFKTSLDWYQRLAHFGIGIGLFYLACLVTLLSSLGIAVFRMFRDYIQADDGSELAMIGAQLDIHSDLNTILAYADNIITKYEDHQLEAVRDGIHSLRSRMQKTIDKGDILEEIRKGIFIHIDNEAEKLISTTAQQTFWGTAISPVAVVDMAIVAWRTMAMIRDISALYGYRPGFLGSLRLFSRILSTIAFAGISEIAVNAGSNLLRNTLLSRLSITLAHALGVGMLTIRVGMAACINCRPLPFQRGELHNHLNLLFRGIKNVLTANFVKEEPEI